MGLAGGGSSAREGGAERWGNSELQWGTRFWEARTRRLALLSRYGHYIKTAARDVGGNFVQKATQICDDLISYTHSGRRDLSATELLHRLETFRSQDVTIDAFDPDFKFGTDTLKAMTGLDRIDVSPFRCLARLTAVEEVFDSSPTEYTVTVHAVPASHSAALLGVVNFEGAASEWIVPNVVRRLVPLAHLDASFELIGLGLLDILDKDPTNQAALTFLSDYVTEMKKKVRVVGGDFVQHATDMCDALVAHGKQRLPPHEMRMRVQQLRQDLNDFRSRELSIGESDTSGSSDSNSD